MDGLDGVDGEDDACDDTVIASNGKTDDWPLIAFIDGKRRNFVFPLAKRRAGRLRLVLLFRAFGE